MEKLKDKIWTWIIILGMFLYLMLASSYLAYTQSTVDTIVSKKYKEHAEFLYQQHKKQIDELENPDKYQMIYFDKVIIDKKNHKIYVYSSYDLYWAEEIGAMWSITIPNKLKPKTKKDTDKKGIAWKH